MIDLSDIKPNESAERFEDMSHRGRLGLVVQEDGDIIVYINPDPSEIMRYTKSVEFCELSSGGGGSPHTRAALVELFRAIRKDNEENPQYRDV